MNDSWVWIRFGTGQPFKVSISDCQDVADLIEASRNKLGLSDRLDPMDLKENSNNLENLSAKCWRKIILLAKMTNILFLSEKSKSMATCYMVDFAKQLFSENQICSTF